MLRHPPGLLLRVHREINSPQVHTYELRVHWGYPGAIAGFTMRAQLLHKQHHLLIVRVLPNQTSAGHKIENYRYTNTKTHKGARRAFVVVLHE